MGEYARTIDRFGAEFTLLLQTPLEEISSQSPLLAEAVNRIRSGRVIRQPGYDGEPGVIRVFAQGEQDRLAVEGGIFGDAAPWRGRRLSTKPEAIQPSSR
jgi:PHP family Zn ribbon phosphoesterase